MKKMIFILIFLVTRSSMSAQFKGFQKSPQMKSMKLTEKIISHVESSEVFLISISNHSAYYRFPKNKSTAVEIKSFLDSRSQRAKTVEFEINPATSEILSMKDNP